MDALHLTVPKGWADLTQKQLRFLYNTMVKVQHLNQDATYSTMEDAALQTVAQVNTLCLMEWSGLKMVCRYGNGWLVRKDDKEYKLTASQVAAAIVPLDWTKDLPSIPVRLEEADGAKAATADLSEGFCFDNWLTCETLWQAYMMTHDESCLKQMGEVLYDKKGIKLTAGETLGIFYWWASAKQLMSAMFPNFLQTVDGSEGHTPNPDDLRRNVNSQIRALTKGDITKESTVLAMEAIRALTELDAQAREYDELNRKYPSK